MGEAEFNVVEIFDSIDGEGKRTGELATFIRLAGCNLRCSYCDTPYGLEFNQGDKMTLTDIINACKEFGNKNVTLTGGEPLARLFIGDLITELALNDFEVNIDTNGSIPLYKAPKLKNVFYTMDYKCPSSEVEDKMDLDNLKFLDKDDVLKFVVGSEEDLERVATILDNNDIKAQIYISPVFGKIEPVAIVDFMKQHKDILKNAKVQVQLHKIIWDPNERGV